MELRYNKAIYMNSQFYIIEISVCIDLPSQLSVFSHSELISYFFPLHGILNSSIDSKTGKTTKP